MAIETVYKYQPTETELRALFGVAMSEAQYLKIAEDKDTENGLIFRLFMLRGDPKKAKPYLDKIDDEEYKRDLRSVDVVESPSPT